MLTNTHHDTCCLLWVAQLLTCTYVCGIQVCCQEHTHSTPTPWSDVGPGDICHQQRHSGVCLALYNMQFFTGAQCNCVQLLLHAEDYICSFIIQGFLFFVLHVLRNKKVS